MLLSKNDWLTVRKKVWVRSPSDGYPRVTEIGASSFRSIAVPIAK